MIYEPKLEPPKFNPDLASLNQSNNSLNSVNNSVTLTPVSNFNNLNHKSINSYSNSEGVKQDRLLNDKVNNKTPNVVVKIGKHGEVHHAKKDSPHNNHDNPTNSSPTESEAILERVTGSDSAKDEVSDKDKKGFTNANFTESYLPNSSVSVTASLIKHNSHNSDKHLNQSDNNKLVDTSRVKLEAPDTIDAPSSVSLVNVSKTENNCSSNRSAGGHSEPDTTHPPPSSHNSIPHFKGDLKTTVSSHNNYSTSESTSLQTSVANTMYARPGLHSSVSLFPTNAPSSISQLTVKSDQTNSQPQTAVSIIPSVTSSSSSVSSLSSSSLTVTPVDSSSGLSISSSVNVTKSANSEAVTISSVVGEDRLTLETLNQTKNNGAMNSQNKVETKIGNGPVKRLGRPPKKGTHTTTSSLGNVISVESDDEDTVSSGSKRPRTEDTEKPEDKVIKKEENDAGIHKFMMFGATLNPTSGMAKEMSTVLQNEVAAHSVYSGETSNSLVGVPLPGPRRSYESGRSAPHTVAGMLDPARQPQTLEELLERHWEQGSRFLMEQASHFDIASLLSSLHQLKEENLGLEDSVDRLIARRDHLLAVRARLLALNSLTVGSFPPEQRREPAQNGPTNDRRLVSPINSRQLVSPSRDKTLPSPRDRGAPPGPPLPSPRDRRELQSPRDRERSPRLPVGTHHPMENGLDGPGPLPPGYRHERLSNAQLLSVAHQSNNSNHRQHSPVTVTGHPGHPPKAHYSSAPPPGHGPPQSRGHVELRGNYPPSNYQMVSPPPPKGALPAHSSHIAMSRSTPPGMRNTPPGHPGPPPPSHHGLLPDLQHPMMRVSPQSTIHLKK